MNHNKTIMEYLHLRGVKDKNYQDYLLHSDVLCLKFQLCSLNGFDYMVNHLFDASERLGYGLIPTNRVLNTDKTSCIAIGLIEGDDMICMDVFSGEIFLWMIQTGEGERLRVASSFKEFMELTVHE